MVFNMAKRWSSRRELKKTKKIKKVKKISSKEGKKCYYSISNSYSSYYDSYLYSDIEWEKIRQPSERKDIHNLVHVLTNEINNKDQCNEGR